MRTLMLDEPAEPNQAIVWSDGRLLLLDQRVLPAEERYVELTDARQTATAIREMVVRGAPAIGITAAYGVVLSVMLVVPLVSLGSERSLDFSFRCDILPVLAFVLHHIWGYTGEEQEHEHQHRGEHVRDVLLLDVEVHEVGGHEVGQKARVAQVFLGCFAGRKQHDRRIVQGPLDGIPGAGDHTHNRCAAGLGNGRFPGSQRQRDHIVARGPNKILHHLAIAGPAQFDDLNHVQRIALYQNYPR